MKKILLLLFALLVVITLTACGGNDGNSSETTVDGEVTQSETTAEEASVNPDETTVTEDTAVGETEAQTTVAEETTEEETTAPDRAVLVTFDGTESAVKKMFTQANQCAYELVNDETEGTVLKMSTKGSAVNDPFLFFNYTQYCKAADAKAISANDYKYVVLKIKCENMTSSQFELFYCAGKITGASAEATKTVAYDNSDPNWQYILFDLSQATWSGKVVGFRFDFASFCKGEGETVYLSEIRFMQSDNDYYRLIGYDPDSAGTKYEETPEQKAVLDNLVATEDAAKDSGYFTYQHQNAANESSDISLGFRDMTTRTAHDDNSVIGTESYLIRMAKNEIEGVQAIVAANKGVEGVKVYVTDFENKNGKKLETSLLWGYYFDVDGKSIIDPLPPVKYAEDLKEGDLDWNNGGNDAGAYIPNYQKYNGFDIPAGTNQSFIIKAFTDKDTETGEYTATFTVKDKDGKEIKKSTIFVYVWNFALPEETTCKTLADISWFALYSNHKAYNGDGGLLYQYYYDYLLENRICGYDIPYNNNAFNQEKLISYLNNPRVTAFQTVGWKTELTAENVSNAYNFLKDNPNWLAKAYFYPIDEPNLAQDPKILQKINDYGRLLNEYFPGYKLIVPMHLNSQVGDGDYFTEVSESVTVWCPHTFFFNTFEEYLVNRKLTYRMSSKLEKTLGTFGERMAKEQEGGDEVWWYVTRFPQDPEITLTMNTNEINYRILFWQQKLYNVDGFLYYSVTDWFDPESGELTTKTPFAPTQDDFPGYDGPISGDGAPTVARPIGLNSKHETNSAYPYNVYGNGVLVYIGQYFGEYGPVGCYRLECVRDGIEDYEYLTLIEKLYGEETADLLIKRITTSLSEYTSDEEYLMQMRNALGNLIAAKQ